MRVLWAVAAGVVAVVVVLTATGLLLHRRTFPAERSVPVQVGVDGGPRVVGTARIVAGASPTIGFQVRRAGSAEVPALEVAFDGSGGGDALVVECRAASSPWRVAKGEVQPVLLRCDRAVTPFGLSAVQQVRVETG